MNNKKQLLRYYNELNDVEKKSLETQLNNIDFDFMNKLYINSFIDEEFFPSNITPLKIINENHENEIIGRNLVNEGSYAICLLAGGLASRLGLNRSKGCLKLNVKGKSISLFELLINQLKEANAIIRLYIMTNKENNKDITDFFEENNYFNYNKEYIKIFIQDELPILDTKGKLLLKTKSEILTGPNGNGNVFKALKDNNLIKDMIDNNIKYVLFSTIDNPILNIVDYNFIGTTIKNNYSLSSKTVPKTSIEDLEWVFCKYNDKPTILPFKFISLGMFDLKDDSNNYIYRQKNIVNHLISIDNIEKFSNINFKYHRAYKKNNYLDENGVLTNTDKPNSFKFEQFIFDAFSYAKDMLLYQVSNEYFKPIKVKEDIKIVEDILNK